MRVYRVDRVQNLRLKALGSGFRVEGSGFWCRVESVEGLGLLGLGSTRVGGQRFIAQGFVFRVQAWDFEGCEVLADRPVQGFYQDV